MLVDVQTVSIVVAATGVFIAAINQILSRRRTEKTEQLTLETRQAQLFMQVYNRWSSTDFAEQYGTLRYKHRKQDLFDLLYNVYESEPFHMETFVAVHSMNTFFEGISILVQQQLIDLDLVEKLFSRRIIWYWETMKRWMTFIRKELNDPTQYDQLEMLYNQMKQREQQAIESS